MSPISSRNSVPFPASRNAPERSLVAPVNEPLTWPNSSLSSRSSGMAAQLTAMNGLVLAPAVIVQGACHQFLAGAGLAKDENRGVAVGSKPDRLLHAPHRRRSIRSACSALLSGALLTDLRARWQPLQQGFQFVASDRLGEVIEGAEPHGFDRILRARKRRQHHNGRRASRCDRIRRSSLDPVQSAGHPEVQQHGVHVARKALPAPRARTTPFAAVWPRSVSVSASPRATPRRHR